MNKIILIGRLTKDVDLRYTSNGKAVGSFRMAVQRPFKNQQGEYEADFINCVVWDKAAETIATYVKKGHQFGVEGRLQIRDYEKDGQRVFVSEVVVENFTFLESKKSGSGEVSNNQNVNTFSSHQNNSYGARNSNGGYSQANDPFLKHGQSIDISDSDLPF